MHLDGHFEAPDDYQLRPTYPKLLQLKFKLKLLRMNPYLVVSRSVLCTYNYRRFTDFPAFFAANP